MIEMLNKVFEEKINNGDIEAKLSEKVDLMFDKVFEDLFSSYSSPFKKEIKVQMESQFEGIIKEYDFSKFIPKLESLLTNALTEIEGASSYKKMITNFANVVGFKFDKKEFSLQDLLVEYEKSIVGEVVDDEDIESCDFEKNVTACANVEIIESEYSSYTRKIITFSLEESEKEDYNIVVELFNDNHIYRIVNQSTQDVLLLDDEFVTFVKQLKNRRIKFDDKENSNYRSITLEEESANG